MTTLDTTPAAPRDYDAVTKLLHWSMALLIPAAWVVGVMLENIPRESRGLPMFMHKSVGVLILALLALRLVWRLTHTAPATEKTPFEPWAGLAAKAGHALLYLLMIGVPVGGIMVSFANGRPVPFFGLFEIASPWAVKQPFAGTFAEMHEVFAHLLVLVALGHAVVGILHHVVLKDRTLLKMKPLAKA